MTNKSGRPESASDVDLLARSGHGDAAAFAVLYDRHGRTAYRFALSTIHSVPDAEDILQEVFLTAWSKAKRIRLVDEISPIVAAHHHTVHLRIASGLSPRTAHDSRARIS